MYKIVWTKQYTDSGSKYFCLGDDVPLAGLSIFLGQVHFFSVFLVPSYIPSVFCGVGPHGAVGKSEGSGARPSVGWCDAVLVH